MDNQIITECNSEDGITIALIDGIIAQLRILKQRNLKNKEVQEALKDLNFILSSEINVTNGI